MLNLLLSFLGSVLRYRALIRDLSFLLSFSSSVLHNLALTLQLTHTEESWP